MDPRGGRGTSADIVPTHITFGVDPIRARVAEISLKNHKNAKKFPIDSYSDENFISPFSARRDPLTPKREKTHPEPEYACMQNLG